MKDLAPILLFVYNRPDHTSRTIKLLQQCELAEESSLYIFCDGPKKLDDIEKVNKVREIVTKIKGFKNVKISMSDNNLGLAKSIISGVTDIINQHGKVIVLEDDLLTSRYFLKYMNDALNFYENCPNIWSISGYTPQIEFPEYYHHDVYFIPRACSWGWGTWNNRWNNIDWEINDYENLKLDKKEIRKFNLPGNDMAPMLEDQKKGLIDSWAIRWCYNQYKNNSYTVYPRLSFIENIGMKGEGTHGSLKKHLDSKMTTYYNKNFIYLTELNEDILIRFSKLYNLKLYNYIGRFLKNIGLYHVGKDLYKKLNR